MLNKSNSLLDLLITINDLLEATLKSCIYFLYYLKRRKNLDGTKDVIKLLKKLNSELLVH
jgi:hypothetical protein